jgi:hypothetical protein
MTVDRSRSGRRPAEVIDRLDERSTLDGLIEAVRAGQGRALLVRGDAGVGKTVLLDHLAERASASGCRVARVVSVQSETELAFAGVDQLSAPMLDHVGRLPGPQRDALHIALTASGTSRSSSISTRWSLRPAPGSRAVRSNLARYAATCSVRTRTLSSPATCCASTR